MRICEGSGKYGLTRTHEIKFPDGKIVHRKVGSDMGFMGFAWEKLQALYNTTVSAPLQFRIAVK